MSTDHVIGQPTRPTLLGVMKSLSSSVIVSLALIGGRRWRLRLGMRLGAVLVVRAPRSTAEARSTRISPSAG